MFILRFLSLIAFFSEIRGNHYLPYCDENIFPKSSLYRLDDQLIQLSYDQRYDYSMQTFPVRYEVLVLSGCKSDKDVEAKLFDPEEIFSTAYQAEIWNVMLPPFTESSQLSEVIYRDAAPRNVWGSCTYLQNLFIQGVDSTQMPPDWLSNCTLLRKMNLDSITVSQARVVLSSAPAIEEISLLNLEGFSDILTQPLFPSAGQKQIRKLELSTITGSDKVLPENITWDVISDELIWQISLLSKLNELDIKSFKHFDFCAMRNYTTVTLSEINSLQLAYTDTSHLCFKSLRVMPKLTDVSLFFNQFNEIQFSELYSSNAPRLSVTFDESTILRVLFTRDDYLALNNGSTRGQVSLSLRSIIDCECRQSLWLTRALREDLVTDLKVTCTDGSSLYSQDCEMLECDRIYCESPCICCRDINDTVSVDCRDTDLYELPSEVIFWENVTTILANNLSISKLPKYLLDSLKLLDLSGNDVLLKATEEELANLFKVNSRRVRLAGNGIVCSCDNKPVLEMLKHHKNQIEDYEKLACVDDGMKLRDVDFGLLCAKRDQETAILGSVSAAFVLAVMALIVGIILYYRREVKIFLYARGCCLFLLKEDELDGDRRYDVFLSFCHEDSEMVLLNILPTLDAEYSVCMHYRDWCPGEMILTQINNSVAQSRRTVTIISKSFVKSLWGLMEFRTAYYSSISEGRVRLVMVILDDVLEDSELAGEIRSYVRLNTYVKWGDPWFWDKLRYSLPHNSKSRIISPGSAHAANDPSVENVEMVELPSQQY